MPAHVLDAAIAWQLTLDSSSPLEREEFAKWHAANEEHARAWRQLGMLDQRFNVAKGPARSALLQSREGIRRRVRKLGSGLASVVVVVGVALFASERYLPLDYWLADQRTATGSNAPCIWPMAPCSISTPTVRWMCVSMTNAD